jgi:hypothetical protein
MAIATLENYSTYLLPEQVRFLQEDLGMKTAEITAEKLVPGDMIALAAFSMQLKPENFHTGLVTNLVRGNAWGNLANTYTLHVMCGGELSTALRHRDDLLYRVI